MRRKRRVEITRYSRRITVVCGGGEVCVAAAETAAAIARKTADDATLLLEEVNGGELAGKTLAAAPLRRRLHRFFARLMRRG